jgi:type VI secretion system secreted protein VgrG
MMQPHGGTTEGFHFPLRRGTEVVFTFLGGDPDRPVIAGVVPNAHTPSPINKDNHTKNMIRTGGGNHITFDDAKGKEFIHFFTPKLTEMFMGGPTDDQCAETQRHQFGAPPEAKAAATTQQDVSTSFYLFTDQNAGFNIQTEWWQTVSGDIRVYGGGKLLEQYAGPHVFNVAGNSSQFYGSALKVEVAAGEDRDVTGTWDLKATAKAKLEAPSVDVDATADLNVQTPLAVLGFSSQAICQFGVTDLQFGATTIDIGAMTGQIASIDISVPGGAKISAPSWDVTNPNESWVGAISEWKWGKKAEFTGLSISATGIKAEATGVSASSTGVKLEKVGCYKVLEGVEIKSGGPKVWQVALTAATAGLYSFC